MSLLTLFSEAPLSVRMCVVKIPTFLSAIEGSKRPCRPNTFSRGNDAVSVWVSKPVEYSLFGFPNL